MHNSRRTQYERIYGFLRVQCNECHHEHMVALVCNSNYTSCVLTVMFVLVSYK